KACQDKAYASYKSCRENCATSANEECDEKYQDCVNKGPTSCLKKVEGKTLCYWPRHTKITGRPHPCEYQWLNHGDTEARRCCWKRSLRTRLSVLRSKYIRHWVPASSSRPMRSVFATS